MEAKVFRIFDSDSQISITREAENKNREHTRYLASRRLAVLNPGIEVHVLDDSRELVGASGIAS